MGHVAVAVDVHVHLSRRAGEARVQRQQGLVERVAARSGGGQRGAGVVVPRAFVFLLPRLLPVARRHVGKLEARATRVDELDEHQRTHGLLIVGGHVGRDGIVRSLTALLGPERHRVVRAVEDEPVELGAVSTVYHSLSMVCGVMAVCHGGVPYSVICPPGQLNCTASGPVRPWLVPMSMSMSWTRAFFMTTGPAGPCSSTPSKQTSTPTARPLHRLSWTVSPRLAPLFRPLYKPPPVKP